MTRLATLAPGKVNLCLFVGRPEPGGLHPLVSVVQPVSLADELVLERAPGAAADEIVCPGVEGPNLAARALALYREASGWDGPPVRLTIRKRVPVAAGMGGGSADAAAALRLAAAAAGVPDDPLVAALAPRLGSDVPALLRPVRTLVTGTGQRIEPLPAGAPEAVVIVPSPHALSTAVVYREADRLGAGRTADGLARLERAVRAAMLERGAGGDAEASGRVGDDAQGAEREAGAGGDAEGTERARRAGRDSEWFGREPPPALPAVNDLEAAALALCPPIGPTLAALHAAGADRALVSGSGPTVFGAFGGPDGPERARAAAACLPGALVLGPADPEAATVRTLP